MTRFLELGKYATDFRPIDESCPCPTCREYTSRALLHHNVAQETAAAHGEGSSSIPSATSKLTLSLALTLHNLTFQAQVMGRARNAIIEGRFPDYLRSFFAAYFGTSGYPEWCVNALRSVGVDLLEGLDIKTIPGNAVKWDYSNLS